MARSSAIKLRAHDAEDLQVLAACLQDALVPLRDLAFLKRERRFIMVANRFKWESADEALAQAALAEAQESGAPEGRAQESEAEEGDVRFEDAAREPPFERVNCGVCFDRVRAVRTRGLDMTRKDQVLDLLTLHAEPRAVTLIFAGGTRIRLEVTGIACHLEDLGEPWPTRWQPSHAPEETAEAGD